MDVGGRGTIITEFVLHHQRLMENAVGGTDMSEPETVKSGLAVQMAAATKKARARVKKVAKIPVNPNRPSQQTIFSSFYLGSHHVE